MRGEAIVAIEADKLEIAVRAYVPSGPKPIFNGVNGKALGPSQWALIFDAETKTDTSQALRFGAYQLRKGEMLKEEGLFFDPEVLSAVEQATLCEYAKKRRLTAMTVSTFIEDVFFGVGYDLNAAIIGFNLPFDISRLAIGHGSARGKSMRGGFTFRLSPDPWKPRVQVKHLPDYPFPYAILSVL